MGGTRGQSLGRQSFPPGEPAATPTSVLTVFGEADENVVGPELLLRELQEGCETEESVWPLAPDPSSPGAPQESDPPVLAALRQRPSRELDVEATTVPHRPPGDLLGLRERGLDAQDPGLVVRRWLLCHIQPLVLGKQDCQDGQLTVQRQAPGPTAQPTALTE